MESSSKHMVCILKIESPKSKWVKSLEKLLNTINDMNFAIDERSKTVYIYGKVDPQIIVENITKSGEKAEIVWSNQGEKKKIENRKEHLTEQCYPSGFMNGPHGYPNYHQQQCYYPPWMCQPRPHPQTYGLPPPYVHHSHPQPPPPPPYDSKSSEPAAKSFPPTPPPPKTFVMGDLSCRIM